MDDLVTDLDQLDVLMPQMIAQFPPMIETMESTRTMMLTMHSTMSGMFGQMDEASDNATAMGKAFDAARNDDSFYLPPEIFKNEDFKRVMDMFLSPDGKAARMLISQRGDPASPEGIARVDPIMTAAEEALKGTPLENAEYLPHRHRSGGEGSGGGLHLRSLDRGRRCALPHFHHHADHDAKSYCRPGHRGHGSAFAGRVLWAVGAHLAAYSRYTNSLGRARDVGDRPFGGGV